MLINKTGHEQSVLKHTEFLHAFFALCNMNARTCCRNMFELCGETTQSYNDYSDNKPKLLVNYYVFSVLCRQVRLEKTKEYHISSVSYIWLQSLLLHYIVQLMNAFQRSGFVERQSHDQIPRDSYFFIIAYNYNHVTECCYYY